MRLFSPTVWFNHSTLCQLVQLLAGCLIVIHQEEPSWRCAWSRWLELRAEASHCLWEGFVCCCVTYLFLFCVCVWLSERRHHTLLIYELILKMYCWQKPSEVPQYKTWFCLQEQTAVRVLVQYPAQLLQAFPQNMASFASSLQPYLSL